MAAKQYRVLEGLNFGPTNKRYEPDEVVTDLPPDSIKWLVSQGYIRAVSEEKAEDKRPEPQNPTAHLPTELPKGKKDDGPDDDISPDDASTADSTDKGK